MILTKKEIEIINLLSNDVSVKDIGIHINKSTSTVEKILSKVRYKNQIETNTGLVGEYLNELYFNKTLVC